MAKNTTAKVPTIEKLDPKVDGSSLDILSRNIETMRGLFPEVFTEGSDDDGPRWKVDLEKLGELLGEYVEDKPERYSFNWHGKSRARRIAQTPSTGTLRPCPEESVNWDTTKNIFIEGDNLEVLKLLQKSYHKRVKMIFIDPPYNTGKEFIYPDKFQDNLDTYLRYTGQIDDDGFRVGANTDSSGRFHTNWLNMMYPRLMLARNLLSDDGAIFISIDDNEFRHLRGICDEIFGEENFVVQVIWQKRVTPENRRAFSHEHDYVICYSKNKDVFSETRRLLPLTDEARARYKNPDNDPRGDWQSMPAIAQAGHGVKSQFYKLQTPDGRLLDPPKGCCWRYSEKRMKEAIEDNQIWFGAAGTGVPRIKRFISDTSQGLTPSTLWFAKDVGANEHAKKELKALMSGEVVFDHPKPVGLASRMMDIATSPNSNDLVLDFFAGSGSTAHAVMAKNTQDKGNRRFMAVQLPENILDEARGENAAADFCKKIGRHANIAELSKERIRRASRKLGDKNDQHKVGLGFRVFALDASNIQTWDAEFDTLDEALINSVENIKPDRSNSDVLHELLLKFGLDLAAPIEEREIAGNNMFIIGAGALVVSLEDRITLDVVEAIADLKDELQPELMRVVFKDSAFPNDVAKTNAIQILRKRGIDDVKSL